MAKNTTKTKQELIAYFKGTPEGQRKLKVTKNNIESPNAEGIKDIFAVISKTNIRTLLGKQFYAFDKLIKDPSGFTLKEIDFLAEFFDIDKKIFTEFLRKSIPPPPPA